MALARGGDGARCLGHGLATGSSWLTDRASPACGSARSDTARASMRKPARSFGRGSGAKAGSFRRAGAPMGRCTRTITRHRFARWRADREILLLPRTRVHGVALARPRLVDRDRAACVELPQYRRSSIARETGRPAGSSVGPRGRLTVARNACVAGARCAGVAQVSRRRRLALRGPGRCPCGRVRFGKIDHKRCAKVWAWSWRYVRARDPRLALEG